MRPRSSSDPGSSYRYRFRNYIRKKLGYNESPEPKAQDNRTVEDIGRNRFVRHASHLPLPQSSSRTSRDSSRARATQDDFRIGLGLDSPAPSRTPLPRIMPPNNTYYWVHYLIDTQMQFLRRGLQPSYGLTHRVVAGQFESKGFARTMFNRFLQRRANRRSLAKLAPPRQLSSLESSFVWLTAVMISFPWLSYILLLSFLKTKRKEKVQLTSAWANFLLVKVFKVRLFVEAPFNYGPPPHVYVVLNQTSLLETVLLLPLALPADSEVFLFANLEFLMIPLLGWVFWKSLGAEMVIRQNKKQARGAVDRSVRRMLRDKASVVISIEGRRSEKGQLSPYKKGPAVLALKTGATIIPIVIQGTREIWPYGHWKVGIGGDVKIKFLEGIPTKGLTMDHRHEIIEKLRLLADKEVPRPLSSKL